MKVKVLSVRRPWCYLIIYGMTIFEKVDLGDGKSTIKDSGKVLLKDIENRNWRTNYRGELYIHAGTKEDKGALEWLLQKGFSPFASLMMFSNLLPKGAIIGKVNLVDIIEESPSPWFTGKFGFVLRNREVLEKPILCKGKLGIFEVVI
jgi:hypothetical protein